MTTSTYDNLVRHAEGIASVLTLEGMTRDLIEDANDDALPTFTVTDGVTTFYDVDGSEIDAETAYMEASEHYHLADRFLGGALDVEVHASRSLCRDVYGVTHFEVLMAYGGPTIWVKFEPDRTTATIECAWGGDTYTLHAVDELGVSDYLTEMAQH